MKVKIALGTLMLAVVVLFNPFYWNQQQVLAGKGEWKAPAWADTLKSSLVGTEKAVQAGQKIYAQLCAICHGNSGKGDGVAGMALNPRPADLTSERVQKQSDGAIYWKITTGRPPMASYQASLNDEQRWQLVAYIRSLAKKKK